MDLAVFSEDFRPQLVRFLRSRTSSFRLLRKMGKVDSDSISHRYFRKCIISLQLNDSFEVTVQSKMGYKVSIDLFLMFRSVAENGTYRWVGGASGN